jgi:hypothetical protein
LYGHAFNARRRSGAPGPAAASALAWAGAGPSLPVSQLADPRVIRAALDGLCTRLDGSPAAASTITRKRAVFHGALGYAVELGLLPANPAGLVRWRAPRAAVAVSPATVPSPGQVRVILAEVARIRATHSPRDTADGSRNRSLCAQKPVTQSSVTGFDLRKCVAGVGFEPT